MAHLILQAPRLSHDDIERLAAVACADGVQEIAPTAVRLLNVDPDTRTEALALAQSLRMDVAWLETIRRLSDCRLLAMDMDSTLISIECIDELAAAAGRQAEVAAITSESMHGRLDFAESLRRRVAMLQGVPATALEQVFKDRLRLNPGAEHLIQAVQEHGVKVVLVSGGFTFFTDRLQRGLMLDEAHANTLEIADGRLTGRLTGPIVDGAAKAGFVQAAATALGATPEQIIVLGDGANDLAMMALAHYSVAWRAKPVVRAQARFALDVSPLDAVLNWFRRQH